MEWIALAHALTTCAMTGLIWFVQVVHYPLFARVPEGEFTAYEREHVHRTGRVVAPLMGAEAAAASLLLVFPPAGVPSWLAWVGAALLGVIWLSTAFLQVPEHRRLSAGPDGAAVRRLVGTNWIRTAAWTLRVPVAAWIAWPIQAGAA